MPGRNHIARTQSLHALPKLAENQHRQAKVVGVDLFEPAHDAAIGADALADLRRDIRVEQKDHKRTRRARVRGISKSRSSPTSGIESRWSFRLPFEPGRR